jgi:diacylglycerol kinase (ATP)
LNANGRVAMKIALIHNASSGRRVSPDSLRELITREGHELVRVIEHSADASRLADPPAELVVAAGGDGTVAEAMRVIAGRGVPMAVLPLGTANNIAFTLGLGGPLEAQVRGWHDAPAHPFDLGVLQDASGPRPFIEGVGGGLVEACLTSFHRRPLRRGEPAPWQLVRALRRYQQALARLRPRPWSLRVDGNPLSGEFLLVEVLNIRAVGPNLELAPSASPKDGALTVVTAREADRAALADYIAGRLAGSDGRLRLATASAYCVDIDDPQALHVDDELASFPPGAAVSIRIQAGAVHVLVSGA